MKIKFLFSEVALNALGNTNGAIGFLKAQLKMFLPLSFEFVSQLRKSFLYKFCNIPVYSYHTVLTTIPCNEES